MKLRKIIFALFFTLGLVVFLFVFINFSSDLLHNKKVFTASLAQDEPEIVTVAEFAPEPKELIVKEEKAVADKQDQIDDILEKIDILKQQIADLEIANKKIEIVDQKNETQKDEKDQINVVIVPENNLPKIISFGSTVKVYPKILISEVQIRGQDDAKQEFVELYNPNDQEVDLTSWYLQRKTKNASSFSSYAPNTLFIGKKITAGGYFLIARQDSGFLGDIFVDNPLTEDNSLFLKNPNEDVVDKVGFGQAQDYETAPVQNPTDAKSIGRKFSNNNEIDTDDNSLDFEIDTPTPKTQNVAYVAHILSVPPPLKNILVNEIQTAGITTKDEFVELYNPNEINVNLAGFSLKKKTSGGNESNLVSSAAFLGTIPAFGYFLIAPQDNDDGTKNYTGLITPDLRYSGKTFSIASDNTILLYNSGEFLLDKVGFGDAKDFETTAAPNPQKTKSIGRIKNVDDGKFGDTDNNAVDFQVQDADPRNTNYVPPVDSPPPADVTPPTRSEGQPNGALPSRTTQVDISLITDELATCKYSTVASQTYEQMSDTFLTTDGLTHFTTINALVDGNNYNYYVRCSDALGNKNTDDFVISFNVDLPPDLPLDPPPLP